MRDSRRQLTHDRQLLRLLHFLGQRHAIRHILDGEAERDAGSRAVRSPDGVDFVPATADSVDEVWAKLRRRAELADVRRRAESFDQAAVQAS